MRTLRTLVTAAALALLAACGGTRVTEQHYGIETSFGSISNPNLPQGFNWEAWGTDTHLIPLTELNYPAVDDDPQTPSSETVRKAPTRDSLQVDAQVAMTWKYNPATIVEVFKSKRSQAGDLQAAVNFEIANALRSGFRSAVATKTIEDLVGPQRATFDEDVKKHVQEALGPRYIVTKVFVNHIELPASIAESRQRIIAQVAELKSAQNREAIAKANASAQIEQARGDAEANRLRAASYSENKKMVDLEIAKALAGLCNGVTTCVIGGSTADLLFKAREQ